MNPRSLLLLIAASFAVYTVPAQTAPADKDAKLIKGPLFMLSDEAAAVGIDGKVMVALQVDKNGKVALVVPYGGPSWPCGSKPIKQLENMWEAVKQNVKASNFSPAIRDGKPVSSDLEMTFLVGQAYRDAVNKRKKPEVAAYKANDEWLQGGVVNGKALKLPKPEYPSEAHSQRISGAVSIDVLIDETGKVMRAGAVSGHPLLQGASRSAACDARFSPTLFKGQPVKVSGIITYNFVP